MMEVDVHNNADMNELDETSQYVLRHKTKGGRGNG